MSHLIIPDPAHGQPRLPKYHYFQTILQREDGVSFFLMPDRLFDGRGEPVYLQGTINLHPFKAIAEPWQLGQHRVTISALDRNSIWFEGSHEVDLAYVYGFALPKVEIPEDIAIILQNNPDLSQAFARIGTSEQQQIVLWVDSSSSLTERQHRLDRFIKYLGTNLS